QNLAVGGISPCIRHRDLMRAPEVLHLLAVDLLRSGPAFRAAQNDHRPAWALARPAFRPRLSLNVLNSIHGQIHGRRHGAMHWDWLMPLHEERLVAVATEEIAEFPVRHARQQSGIGD